MPGLETRTIFPTFTFKNPFSAPKQACGPEARALRGKSIGGKRILPGDPARLPQNGAGRSGARPGAPTSEDLLLGERTACPPDPRNEACLMIFCAQCPCFRATSLLWSRKGILKSEGGKNCPCFQAGHGLKFNRPYAMIIRWFIREGYFSLLNPRKKS
jgi:hypothetical protein